MPFQVFVLGHSFVRHAAQYINQHQAYANFGLDPSTHHITTIGKTSWDKNISTVADIEGDLVHLVRRARGADLVIIDIGTNDLNNAHALQPRTLVAYCQEVAGRLTANGVKRVAFVHLLFRLGPQAICRDLNASEQAKEDPVYVKEAVSAFMLRAHATNNLISIRARASTCLGVIPQKGLTAAWKTHLHEDGVHIKEEDMPVYLRNIRSAIIRESNRSLGDRRPCNHPYWLLDA